MALRLLISVTTLLLFLFISPTLSSSAEGTQAGYVILGGTPQQRAEVTKALDASTFDWSIVPAVVQIQIASGRQNWAKRGHIRLSAELLDQGRRSWGTVQHEYAHQVDLQLLTTSDRLTFLKQLGARVWFGNESVPHAERGAERFASTFAWAYWRSPANSMRPLAAADESAAMEPSRFRALLTRTLG